MKNITAAIVTLSVSIVLSASASKASLLPAVSVSVETYGGLPEISEQDGSWCDLRDKITLEHLTISRTLYCGENSTDNKKGVVRLANSKSLSIFSSEYLIKNILNIVSTTNSFTEILDSSCSNIDDINFFSLNIQVDDKDINFRGPNSALCVPNTIFRLLDSLHIESNSLLSYGSSR